MNKRGTSIVVQMRKVEALNEKEQTLGAQITALQASQRECADSYQEQLGELVTKMAVAAGVHRLPLAVIDAAFKHIVDCGSDATIANEWIAKYSGAAIANAVRDPDGGSRMRKAEGGILVTVKLSANTSDKNKSALRKAGLKWNGRRRSWIGTADAEAQARLRELFGDRVQVQTQLTPSTGRDRSPAADMAPQDAAVGGATATDASVPDHAGPATPAGASGSAAVPTTPPVDQAYMAVMPPGGAVVVGAEAVAATAGDAPVAPAPVPPPVVAKSPAPSRPALRFPNFPRAGARG